jgi:3-dehydroquinate synthase
MIREIKVRLSANPYSIFVGKDALRHLPRLIRSAKIGKDAILIATPVVLRLHGKKIKDLLKRNNIPVTTLVVPDSEKSKNAQIAFRLIEKITRFDVKKEPFIIAFGGGVVGDLSGFIAAIYRRGIPYIQVPTTLLAQVDSAIGGKTAIDTAFGKNLVGSFYQPRLVLADTSFLKTLPLAQLRAGLSEVIKYATIRDRALFGYLSKNYEEILSGNASALEPVIVRCASIKADVVAKDEFDKKGIRVILNFGHTFAHAIEKVSGFKIAHGEAVAAGMACAAELSCLMGFLETAEKDRLIGLLDRMNLPTKIKNMGSNSLLKAMAHDKKFSKKNRFVVLEKIGRVKIAENIPKETIRQAIEKRRGAR